MQKVEPGPEPKKKSSGPGSTFPTPRQLYPCETDEQHHLLHHLTTANITLSPLQNL